MTANPTHQTKSLDQVISLVVLALRQNFGDSIPYNGLVDAATRVATPLYTQWHSLLAQGMSKEESANWLVPVVEGSIALMNDRFNDESGRTVACQKGCGHCCKGEKISLTWREARSIAAKLGSMSTEMLQMVQRQAKRGKTKNFKNGIGSPCALLVDEVCSVYGARPMTCRGLVSSSLDDCLSRYKNGTTVSELLYPRAIEFSFETIVGDYFEVYEMNTLIDFMLKKQQNLAKYVSGELPAPRGLLSRSVSIKLVN